MAPKVDPFPDSETIPARTGAVVIGGGIAGVSTASISVITPDGFRFLPDFEPSVVKNWHELRLRIGGRFITEWNTPRCWGDLIDVTPDAVPVISDVDTVPGLFIATGFSGRGFGIGPDAGRLMTDLVTGATAVVDAAPYRLSRFARRRHLNRRLAA